jgi:hypothetical protein
VTARSDRLDHGLSTDLTKRYARSQVALLKHLKTCSVANPARSMRARRFGLVFVKDVDMFCSTRCLFPEAWPVSLLPAISACSLAVMSAAAGSTLTTVEPDLFPTGTNLGSRFDGVTLSVLSGHPSVVVSELGTSIFLGGANIATTGQAVFG